MHENQRIHRSSADQIRRNDSLSKCGWCTEYAVLVNEYSFDRILLLGPKLTMKDSIDLLPGGSFVLHFYLHGV